MRNPHFHIHTARGWLQHHHWQTTVDGDDESVRLLTVEEADGDDTPPGTCDETLLQAWEEAWLGGIPVGPAAAAGDCGPDQQLLVPGLAGYILLGPDATEPWTGEAFPDARFVTDDPDGRWWFLSLDGLVLRCWDPGTFTSLGTWDLPEPADFVVVDARGVIAVQRPGRLWWRSFRAQTWTDRSAELATIPGARVRSGTRMDRGLVLLVGSDDGPVIVEWIGGERARDYPITPLECATLVVRTGPRQVAITEVAHAPAVGTTRFHVFRLSGDGALPSGAVREVRRFDGRAAHTGLGAQWATFSEGLRRWYDARVDWVERGGVETIAMDSGHHLCRWHRVFLDVCLPEGAAVTVLARTSDSLEPDAFVVAPTPPPGLVGVDGVTPLSSFHPLGHTDLDTTGWVEVPDLVDIGPDGDIPHPFSAAPRRDVHWTTLEGLITAPPGRYLWIRVLMTGTRRATPRLSGARCTLPRPDILGLLPSFWKRDPLRAEVMERVLMLFERELSRFDQLALHLPYLFDPRITPPEALDWLGSWLGIVLDDRIGLEAQRTLVTEAVELYRTRGTVPGMTRVAEIVSGVPAIVIEAFRERRGEMSMLGADGARLGEGVGLGAPPVMGADDVERRLVDGWTAGIARRDERRATTGRACPEDAPSSPRLDPAERHFAHHAHRFTVILVGHVCDERYAATHDAIERWKPAHTLHEVCTVSPGARLGITSRPGLVTLVADEGPTTAVLADHGVPLGTQFIIGEHAVRRRIDQEKPR